MAASGVNLTFGTHGLDHSFSYSTIPAGFSPLIFTTSTKTEVPQTELGTQGSGTARSRPILHDRNLVVAGLRSKSGRGQHRDKQVDSVAGRHPRRAVGPTVRCRTRRVMLVERIRQSILKHTKEVDAWKRKLNDLWWKVPLHNIGRLQVKKRGRIDSV